MEKYVEGLLRTLTAALKQAHDAKVALETAKHTVDRRREELNTATDGLCSIPGGTTVAAALQDDGPVKITLSEEGSFLLLNVDSGDFKGFRRLSEVEVMAWLKQIGIE